MLWPYATSIAFLSADATSPNNQPYFASIGAQEAWMLATTIRADVQYAPITTAKPVRVSGDVEKLNNATMLTFVNGNFSQKRWYCNIVRKDYISSNCTEVVLEVNAFQTFMFDMSITGAYVEREHQSNDWNGASPSYNNLQPEPLTPTNYVFAEEQVESFDAQTIGIAVSADPDGNTVAGQMSGNYYFGTQLATGNASTINTIIRGYTDLGKAQAIVAIFMIPQRIDANVPVNTTYTVPPALNGYTPRNAKLLSYPYTFLVVSNQAGEVKDYKFELANDGRTIAFTSKQSLSFAPSAICYPINYEGLSENPDNAVSLKVDAQCMWSSDYFANWAAQNAASREVKALAAGVSTIVGAATGNPLAFIGGIGALAGMGAQVEDAQVKPPTIHGTNAGSIDNLQYERTGFVFRLVTLRAEEAERFDGFLDVFGYATNTAKVPNLRTRPFWNYVKTRNINVHLSTNKNWVDQIENMFNSGVTLWHVDAGAVIGDYSMDNRG